MISIGLFKFQNRSVFTLHLYLAPSIKMGNIFVIRSRLTYNKEELDELVRWKLFIIFSTNVLSS